MPKPISPAEASAPRIVIVTMDSHFGGAVDKARAMLRQQIPGLELDLHAADEFAGDEAALAACRADIARADIIIAGMLFMEDHFRLVQDAIAARREDCDALVCCLSAPEITRLTRMGRLDMSAEAKGLMGLLKRLRGKKDGNGASGKGQMRMLRELPKLLRFIPGTAQDLRAYFLTLQYWLAGSADNLANMVAMLVQRYAKGKQKLSVAAPVEYPETGLYHPRMKGRFGENLAALPRAGTRGTVGLLLLRSYVLAGNAKHYDGMIEALEARGLNVIPAFAAGLDGRPAMDAFFTKDGAPAIDALVSLTGFSLVGGPAYNDARAAEAALAKLDVPYIAAHPLEFQTMKQWAGNARGLLPVEATMMVAIPELDGGIWQMTFGGRCGAGGDATERCAGCDGVSCARDMVPHPERAGTLADRVARLVALRRTERAERKIATVLFNFPPNAGTTGTAAYLGVFPSLFNTLKAMKAAGYYVELPESADALREMVINGNRDRYGTTANLAARVSADQHLRRTPWLAEIEKSWGPAPGRIQTDGRDIFILGVQLGNVFVGVQPGFGYDGDPMRLLFERDFAPTHAFSAFYQWLRQDFGADAVLHFGTHGALEFMPGKQAGMSGQCWPDRLIGDLPNYYLYASNNPSEGMLAKRRAGATLISYLTPPIASAGLYRGLLDLKASIDRWRALDPEADPNQRAALAGLIQAQASAVDLATEEPVWAEPAPEIVKLSASLLELEYTLIPHGMHVVGEPPNAEQRAEMLTAAGVAEGSAKARYDALLAEDHEIPSILRALEGRYIMPAPGGDLLRSMDVLPTGRNLHGFDPFKLPSAFAVQDGMRQAERLLERHLAEGNQVPETVAIVLWGTDNLKTEGG
ncbi:MAG: magnesium chelatase subunit H, partial [Alphaproteobacteria bacterium]